MYLSTLKEIDNSQIFNVENVILGHIECGRLFGLIEFEDFSMKS